MGEPEQHRSDESSEGSFSGLVLMLGTTALVHLGAAPDPASGGTKVNLGQAKQALDLLDVLQAKTAGNLTAVETRILDALQTFPATWSGTPRRQERSRPAWRPWGRSTGAGACRTRGDIPTRFAAPVPARG